MIGQEDAPVWTYLGTTTINILYLLNYDEYPFKMFIVSNHTIES